MTSQALGVKIKSQLEEPLHMRERRRGASCRWRGGCQVGAGSKGGRVADRGNGCQVTGVHGSAMEGLNKRYDIVVQQLTR